MNPDISKNIPVMVKYGTRGFDELIKRFITDTRKSFPVLFSGPAGAGKVTAADIIAAELGLELRRVGLSSLVSKSSGDTEKNLSEIFSVASSGGILLFFDDADSLFGKRSEAKDARDRRSNMCINFLLQKMAEHEGMVILAVNHRSNFDEAFIRRMRYIVEFQPYHARKPASKRAGTNDACTTEK